MIRGSISKADRINHGTPQQFKLGASIHNRFDVEVIDGETGKVKAGAVGFNIVLDALWTRFATAYNWFFAIAYGSGTGALSAARTDLFTRIGAKNAGTLVQDWTHFAEGYVSFRQQIQLIAGEYTGQTLREVGIAYDTTANHLMTHALLKDMNGNTVAITIGALDVINIYATVYIRFNPAGYEGGNLYYQNYAYPGSTSGILPQLAGVGQATDLPFYFNRSFAHAGIISPFCQNTVNNSSDNVRYRQGNIGDNSGQAGSSKNPAISFDIANKKLKIRLSLAAGAGYRIGAAELNPPVRGGYNSWLFSGSSAQSGIICNFPNAAKPYCLLTDEAIGTGDGANLDFQTAFGFILNDGSAVLKVNGVAIDPANYTLEYGVPCINNIGYFLKPISGNKQFWGCGPMNSIAGDYEIIENPFYQRYGISSFYGRSGCKIECSNDLSAWTQIKAAATGDGTVNVNATYQKYRYWKISTAATVSSAGDNMKDAISPDSTKLVHFNAGQAPAGAGAVTLTYHTGSICKDANHVIDMELEILLSEYVG